MAKPGPNLVQERPEGAGQGLMTSRPTQAWEQPSRLVSTFQPPQLLGSESFLSYPETKSKSAISSNMGRLNRTQDLVNSTGEFSPDSGLSPEYPDEERKALLTQKFHTITALTTVAVGILKEEGLSTRNDERAFKRTLISQDTFHYRLGENCGIAESLHALAMLLAQKGITIAVGTGRTVIDPPSTPLMLLAAIDISLTKPPHPFPGHQYISHLDLTASKPESINFVGAAQPGPPFLPALDASSILNDPLSYALDVRCVLLALVLFKIAHKPSTVKAATNQIYCTTSAS